MSKQMQSNTEASPVMFVAFVDFLRWASIYGREIKPLSSLEAGVFDGGPVEGLEVSSSLSASFNFGYEPITRTVFLALDPEEFEWLPKLPVVEVVVGAYEVYVITEAVELAGEPIGAMVFTVKTGQPKLWSVYPHATNVGFVRVRHDGMNSQTVDVSEERYPLRRLND